MKQYYSPFIDKNGSFIPISKIRFSHIPQLKERGIEEGYQVEYKSRWDDNFLKKHLCQTISSFANSEGGWLFVGIEDNTAEYIGIKKPRSDFSQIISQKLMSVSPMPKFESRFIRNSHNKQMGVLAVYIYEGLNPPYVCNGTVYLRSGSSKVPIKSGRIEIDNLVQKRDKFHKKYKEFCVNSLVDDSAKFPFCSVYLYNPCTSININTLTNDLELMKKTLNATGYWPRLSYSSESVLCYGSDSIANNSVTTIAEFFADGNAKISCPLFSLQKNRHEEWADFIKSQNSNVDLSEMPVIDGYISYLSIQSSLKNTFEYMKRCGYHINDYTISFEYKNIKNTVLFFREKIDSEDDKIQYIQKIKNKEFYICPKNEVKTLPSYFINDVELENVESAAFQIMGANFALLFGVTPNDLHDKIIESIPLYEEKIFSSQY